MKKEKRKKLDIPLTECDECAISMAEKSISRRHTIDRID